MNLNCVTGPIARRAEDLWPLLKILADPDGTDSFCEAGKLYGDPSAVRLADLHIISIADNGRQRVSAELRAVQSKAATWLGSQSLGLSNPHVPELRHSFEIWSALMNNAQTQPFAEQLGQGRRIPVARELIKWCGHYRGRASPRAPVWRLGTALYEWLLTTETDPTITGQPRLRTDRNHIVGSTL